MKRLLLIILFTYLPHGVAMAANELYAGEVAVLTQSEAERNAAVPEALIQVLQKISGQRELPASPELDEALSNAGKMLISFGYRSVKRQGPEGIETEELRLLARFIPSETDQLAQRIGLPRWRKERPPVQVWAVVDDGLGRELMPVEFTYAWRSMEDVASIRGLPLSWPELDEEERQLIDMRLVWGGFTDYLVERGAPADGVAIVAARRDGPLWSLRWNVADNDRRWSWHDSDRELRFALTRGVHRLADEIAAANSIAASQQGRSSTDITVGGLRGAEDYATCLAYLEGLSVVTGVNILGAGPGHVRFRLQLNAAVEYLDAALRNGTVLLPSGAETAYDYELVHYGRN
ncbi:MAG: DUF2066 domain-containing protein [Lysobacterales bacterium]|jgi:hypothetical protein